jgi:hypothetical protein
MAKPKFSVQHFIACLNAAWEGSPGSRTARTLEGVHHIFVVPPGAEPPFSFGEVWLYVRLFRTNQSEGRREFSVRLIWLDALGGPQHVFIRPLMPVRFSNQEPVANVAWAVRPVVFPGVGQYEFRLRARTRRKWSGTKHAIVAREFITIERHP